MRRWALGRGGVGYYPRSGFVHVDTGSVRTWCLRLLVFARQRRIVYASGVTKVDCARRVGQRLSFLTRRLGRTVWP